MNLRKTSKTIGCFVVLSLLWGLSDPADARAEPCNKNDKAQAKKLIKRGTGFLRKNKARLAVTAFKQAYGHCKAPAILFNLALAYRVLGDRVAAATHLHRYLKDAGPGARKALPPPLQQLLLEVGVVQVQVQHAKATIWVDGRLVGSGRVEVVVLPGLRVVEIRLEDRVLKHKKLQVSGGQTVFWSPKIVVSSPRLAPGPTSGSGPGPGPSPDRDVKQRGIHWAFFVSAAVLTVAAGAALTYTGVRTLQLKDDYLADPTPALEKDFDRFKLISNVLAGVTALAGATAVIVAVFTRWRRNQREKPRVSISPTMLPGGAGLWVRGSY